MQPNNFTLNGDARHPLPDLKLQFTCTFWGQELLSAEHFVDKVLDAAYDGIEINLPDKGVFADSFIYEIENVFNARPDFIFIAQQLTSTHYKSVDTYITHLEKKLLELAALKPTFINSHTGSDFYSFDENCKVLEACLNISQKTGVRILHETHRGRFSFHAAMLLPYLKEFPELELVGDFSHFCAVSESMLPEQEHIVQQIIPYVAHLHARVGHEHSPQVNDPFAPEWEQHFERFIGWWKQIIAVKIAEGCTSFGITPEHGPFPYMPQMPYSKLPLCDQWETNLKIAKKLKKIFE